MDRHQTTSKLLEIHKSHQTGIRPSSTAHKWDLKAKFTRKRTFTDRLFTIATPKSWKQLPASLKEITSNDTFKKELKTHLFHKAFNHYSVNFLISTLNPSYVKCI